MVSAPSCCGGGQADCGFVPLKGRKSGKLLSDLALQPTRTLGAVNLPYFTASTMPRAAHNITRSRSATRTAARQRPRPDAENFDGRPHPYSAYKDSGVEWLGKIPTHWTVSRISELTTLINGYPFDPNTSCGPMERRSSESVTSPDDRCLQPQLREHHFEVGNVTTDRKNLPVGSTHRRKLPGGKPGDILRLRGR